jgi:hypothetical protein
MSYNPHDKSTDDLVEEWLEHNVSMDGKKALDALRRFLTAVGYSQDHWGGMSVGNQIEDFLADNPDAIEALIRWCNSQGDFDSDEQARQNIIDGLPPACPECGYYQEEATICEDCQEEEVSV